MVRDDLARLTRDTIAIVLLAVAATGCAAAPATAPSWTVRERRFAVSAEPLGELVPGRGVLLAEPAVLRLLAQCSRGTGVEGYVRYWTPASAHIEQLEHTLPAFLSSHHVRPPGPLRVYYRQYGAYIAGGHRFIYANFFHEGNLAHESIPEVWESPKTTWRRDPLVTCDGGPDWWGLSFDVDAGTFSGLDFNGP